jgi:hypothetical protein
MPDQPSDKSVWLAAANARPCVRAERADEKAYDGNGSMSLVRVYTTRKP